MDPMTHRRRPSIRRRAIAAALVAAGLLLGALLPALLGGAPDAAPTIRPIETRVAYSGNNPGNQGRY
jgi:hypothetical protein